MEDPESEWEIQQYSPSKEGETITVKWILKTGYGIGKQMVITGIVISSAPLVVPPLVAFSAMGFAFTVPFGVGFASYACTNSLMSKLLPIPRSPCLLEYYPNEDEEGVDSRFDLDEGGVDYMKTEVGLLTDLDGVEIEDFRKENATQEEEEEEERIREREEGEALMTNGDGDVDEKGYYTDDEEKEGEYDNVVLIEDDEGGADYKQEMEAFKQNMEENLDENEDEVLRREHVIEEEEREQMEDITQGIEMRLALDMAGDDDDDDDDDDHKQTKEVSITNSSGVDEQGYEEDDGEYLEEEDDHSLEEERKMEDQPVEIKGYFNSEKEVATEDETEEIVKGSTGLLEKIRDGVKIDDAVGHESGSNGVLEESNDFESTEPVIVKEIDSEKIVENGSKNDEPVGELRHVVVLAGGNEENNFNSREVEELDLVAREIVEDTKQKETTNMESNEKVKKENMEKTSGNVFYNGSEDGILKTKKENLVHSNADESGLDSINDKNTSIIVDRLEGGDEAKKNTANDDVDVLSLPGFRHAPLDQDKAKLASKTDKKVASIEKIMEDEKIWEKIGAMRAIVGYKAPSQATCIGELKALYVFTGVEPPASFKEDSDLDDANSKLKFLMSIVGVK